MQPWQNAAQNGVPQGGRQNQVWSDAYGYQGQAGQFDPSQGWSQPVPAQPVYDANQPTGARDVIYAADDEGGGSMGNPVNGVASLHGAYDGIPTQYSGQGEQGALEAVFDQFPGDVYGQQGRMDLGQDFLGIPQLSGHANNHGATHDGYPYLQHDAQAFDPALAQFSQASILPQHLPQGPGRVQQSFDGMGHAFNQTPPAFPPHTPSPGPAQQAYNRPPNPSPRATQINAQQSQLFAASPQRAYEQVQRAQYQQNTFVPQQVPFPPSSQLPVGHSYHQAAVPKPSPKPAKASYAPQAVDFTPVAQANVPLPNPEPIPPPAVTAVDTPSPSSQPASTKRKRTTKAAEAAAKADVDSEATDSPVPTEPGTKRIESIDDFTAPTSTNNDLLALAQAQQGAAKARFPRIPGAMFLVSGGAITLPSMYPLCRITFCWRVYR
jgi:hypothetical protein